MDRTYRGLQLANYGLAGACAVLCVVTLLLGRGAVGAAFGIAAVWWAAVAWFWGTRRAGGSAERPAPRKWPEPFEAVDEDTAAGLEAELRRELAMSHPLWGRPAIAVARSTVDDDVLFALDRGEVAVVHLTWLGKKERPGYPTATLFPSAEAFIASPPA